MLMDLPRLVFRTNYRYDNNRKQIKTNSKTRIAKSS